MFQLKVEEFTAKENKKGITVLSCRDKRYALMLPTKHSYAIAQVRIAENLEVEEDNTLKRKLHAGHEMGIKGIEDRKPCKKCY